MVVYIDEAGNLADTNQFFIIGVVSSKKPHDLNGIFKHIRKDILGKKNKKLSEIKFSRVDIKISEVALRKIAKQDVTIYVWIVNKEERRVKDTPENYGIALSYVLRYGFELCGWKKVVIDNKYTKIKDRAILQTVLRKSVGDNLENISFADSALVTGLTVADFVAGAFFADYVRGNTSLRKILDAKIAIEERVMWREIKQKATAP